MSFSDAELVRPRATSHPSTAGAAIEIEAMSAPQATVGATAVPPPSDFVDAARLVAEGEAALERAQGTVRDAQAKLDAISGRIAALESKRDEIARRRAGGDGDLQADDPVQIAALDLDLRSLAAMRHDAAAALALASAAARSAEQSLQNAADLFRLAEEAREHGTLAAHATRLAALLRETLERLLPLETNLSPSRCWAPPPALIEQLRRSAFSARKGW